jgi:twitching motility protein PilT
MVVNPAVRALIRDDKSHQLHSLIQTGGQIGMRTMNQSVFELYRNGSISYEDAIQHSPDKGEFQRLMQRGTTVARTR